MSNFFQLVKNEHIKMYIQKSTWAMYIILALIIVAMGLLTNFTGDPDKTYDDTWRQTLQEENQQLTNEMKKDDRMEGMYNSQIEENNYYLENDIKPFEYDAWQFVSGSVFLLSLVTLFTIIVAAGIIANEFKWGTIKLLLIRPISRTKILLSKYVTVLLFALWTLLFVLVFSFIIGLIFFGINSFDPHVLMNDEGGLEQVSVIQQIVSGYGFKLVTLLMMATFAFMISAIFRQSALAIGTAIFLMFAGTAIVGFLAKYDFAKYILFANTDLSQYTDGYPGLVMEGMSLGFSIIVLIVYYAIFLVITWLFFTKRDVAGH